MEQTRDLAGGIFTLARLKAEDIEQCIKSLDGAQYGGIHVFVGTSPEHRQALNMTQEQILKDIPARIMQVRQAGLICQFSAEDATRTELDFL